MMISGRTETPVSAGSSAPAWLLTAVVALFFIWGGITSLNDVLIPKLKDLFQLSYTQAMLIQFAFFTAYGLVSIPAGGLVARVGYGRGIVVGLSIMAVACALFIPAAQTASYPIFLGALFVLAGGITILQVAANPLIANLGDPDNAPGRLTLAQAFNSLGTTVMPYLGAMLILGEIASVDSTTLTGAPLTEFRAREAAVVGHSYLGLALVLAALAAIFWVWRNALGSGTGAATQVGGSLQLLLTRPRLAFGVAAIFLYVGAEVAIGSFLVNYLMLPSTLGLNERTAGTYISLYWGGAMVGRFVGAALMQRIAAGRLLCFAAIGAMILALVSTCTHGPVAAWSLIAVGLMNSIMFPTIFSLALDRMGHETPKASGLLCMAIVGGAIVPLVAGAVADVWSIAAALVVPAACYIVIAMFGWYTRRPAVAHAKQ